MPHVKVPGRIEVLGVPLFQVLRRKRPGREGPDSPAYMTPKFL